MKFQQDDKKVFRNGVLTTATESYLEQIGEIFGELPDSTSMCGKSSPEGYYACTRPWDHTGIHIATGQVTLCSVWLNEETKIFIVMFQDDEGWDWDAFDNMPAAEEAYEFYAVHGMSPKLCEVLEEEDVCLNVQNSFRGGGV